MNIHQIRDLALKILGIYYLSHALIYAPQICGIFASWPNNSQFQVSGVAIGLSVLLSLLFWLGVGVFLTFRTATVIRILWSQPELGEGKPFTTRPCLAFWIVLIGAFYFVGSLGEAVAELWRIADRRFVDFVSNFLPNLVTLTLSSACVVKARAIEAWLQDKIGQNNQQSVSKKVE